MGCSTGSCGVSGMDPLAEIRGESLPGDEQDSPQSSGFSSILTAPFELAAGAIDAVRDVFINGQNTVGGVFINGQDAVSGAVSDVSESAETVFNPLGLLGLGAGVSFGGVVAVVGLGVVTAVVADQLTTGGAGRAALFASSRRKR